MCFFEKLASVKRPYFFYFRQSQDFKQVLRELCQIKDVSDESNETPRSPNSSSGPDTETSTEADISNSGFADSSEDGCELTEIDPKAFGYSNALRRILNLRLPDEPDACSEADHRIFMSGLINLNLEALVRATGALLQFIDDSGVGSNVPDSDANGIDVGGNVVVIAVRNFTPSAIVGVDEATLTSLQVFSSSWKPSATKVGSWNQKREGLSLFSIMNRCKTVNGVRHLRNMFRVLPRDLATIVDRQNTVAYFVKPERLELIKTFQVSWVTFESFQTKRWQMDLFLSFVVPLSTTLVFTYSTN